MADDDASLSCKFNKSRLRLGHASLLPEGPPECAPQAIHVVKPLPSVRAHGAEGVLQRVEGEAKRLDARAGPVDNACDLAAAGIDQDVHLVEVVVRKDDWIAPIEESRQGGLYFGDGW